MKLPDPVRSGLSSAALVFLITFLPAVLGWLGNLAEWASSSGAEPLPGLSTLGYAAVSAVLAAVGGLVMGVFRWAQGRSNLIPGQPPTWTPPE